MMATITLITGANRGLGLALVKSAIDSGHIVCATVREPANASDLQDIKSAFLTNLYVLPLDITVPKKRAAVIAEITRAFGKIDIVIHNAGINSRSKGIEEGEAHVTFGSLTEEALLSNVKTNAIAPLLFTQELAPLLSNSERGVVVAISSWFASLKGNQDRAFNYSYSGSKTLLNLYFRLAANALKPKGIVAFMVNPGWMKTDMGGSKATLTPEESANAIYAMAKAATPEMAGQFLDWNGDVHPW
jgi:NAD(P)-dependent dehydrogenase (short-subunit alcohol dehydrogenase family)